MHRKRVALRDRYRSTGTSRRLLRRRSDATTSTHPFRSRIQIGPHLPLVRLYAMAGHKLSLFETSLSPATTSGIAGLILCRGRIAFAENFVAKPGPWGR